MPRKSAETETKPRTKAETQTETATETQKKDSANIRFLIPLSKSDYEKLQEIAADQMRATSNLAGFILHQYITGRLIEKPSDKL